MTQMRWDASHYRDRVIAGPDGENMDFTPPICRECWLLNSSNTHVTVPGLAEPFGVNHYAGVKDALQRYGWPPSRVQPIIEALRSAGAPAAEISQEYVTYYAAPEGEPFRYYRDGNVERIIPLTEEEVTPMHTDIASKIKLSLK